MNRKTSHGLSLAVLAALFVVVILFVNLLFRGWQLDLTPNKQYTLADGTKEILSQIDEPISLTFFFSEQASEGLPHYRAYAQRVREMLEAMASRANGKLKLKFIDPQPFSEEEDEATSYGIQPVPTDNGLDKLIFGLAGSNSTNGQQVVPFFQIEKETFLEYDLARMIETLNKPAKVVVGVVSSLPMTGGFDQTTRQMSQGWAIYDQLNQLVEMRPLGTELTSIDAAIKVLLLVHPKNLNEDTLYAIDQFVLRGGRLVVMVDPNATQDRTQSDPNNPMGDMFTAKTSDLPKLFSAWKLRYDPNQVVADRIAGLEVQTDPSSPPTKSPVILALKKGQMSQSDIVSSELEMILLDTAGQFKLDESAAADGITLEPLLHSSNEATLVEGERVRFLPNPTELLQGFSPSGEEYVIAGRLKGKLKTAFPEKSGDSHLAEAKEAVEVIVIADTDIATDRTWVQVGQFFGQRVYQPFSNNGDFLTNVVENLSGSNALISIRARGAGVETFGYVDELRNQASASYADVEKKLNDELRQTEQRLTELQQAKSADQQMIISPEQRAELERFQKRKVEIRKELRKVQADLNADVRTLGTALKVLNILVLPLVIAVVGLWYFLRRRSRRTQATV